jgi:cation:H+ antiporter
LVGLYLGIALVIIFSAYHLGIAAETLAKQYHLASTFAGAILLGVVTSLPELTNAITSSRRNEADLAVGNVLGANAFVLVVLAIADFFYLPQSIFLAIPEKDALSSMIVAFLAIIMQGFFLGALAGKSRHQVWKLGTVSLFILGLYVFSIFILQRFSEVM